MNDAPVIVWDLDGTLGQFSALEGQADCTEWIEVQVRPHLREAIEQLTVAGFRHTLLTLSTPLYAEVVLRGIGLREHFVQVDGAGQRRKGDAVGIAATLGIRAEEIPHRLFFVGDHPHFDEPRHHQVLFHLESFGLQRSAHDLVRLVLFLRELGNGSFWFGFNRLAGDRAWWRRPWRRWSGMGIDQLFERRIPEVGTLALLRRRTGCPVIGFAHPPDPMWPALPVSFVPATLTKEAQAMQ